MAEEAGLAEPVPDALAVARMQRLLDQLREDDRNTRLHSEELEGLSKANRAATFQKLTEYALSVRMGKVDEEALEQFFKHPYILVEARSAKTNKLIPGRWQLWMPRYVPVSIGFLELQTPAWNRFAVNRYMDFFGELPEYVKKEVGWVEGPDLKIAGDELIGAPSVLKAAVSRYAGMVKPTPEGKVVIDKTRTYELIVTMLKEGIKPFSEQPIDPADLIDRKFDFELRGYQKEMWEKLKRYSHIGSFIPPSTGKCHRKGQMLLMFDGTLRAVETLRPGERLMGPDSRPRRILSVSQGHGKMMEVIPHRGKPWVVNEEHMLTLVRNGDGSETSNRHKWACYRRDGEVVDVSVREWMSWSKSRKWHHKLFHAPVEFPSNYTATIDPYVLGVILGDGGLASGTVNITTQAPEIQAEIMVTCARYGVGVHEEASGNATTYRFTQGRTGPRTPEGYRLPHGLGVELKALGLLPIACEDKFIPDSYLTATRNIRLGVLAGLIDTDGSYSEHGHVYDFISKSERLVDGVAFLARSLGLSATVKICRKSAGNGVWGTYHRVTIGGALAMVPCRVPRKQARGRVGYPGSLRDTLHVGFRVEPLALEEDYYGFTLDGDGRYLLDDFTVTHNTVEGGYTATHLRGPGLVVVPTKTLIEQWTDFLQSHTDLKLGEEVIICTYWTAIKRHSDRLWGWIIFDEVHHMPAPQYIKLSLLRCKYSLSLSACIAANTPILRDDWSWAAVNTLSGETVSLTSTGSMLSEVNAPAAVMQTQWSGRSGITLSTHSGKSLTATEDHPLLGYRDGAAKWLMASEFVPGDFIGMSDVEPLTAEDQRTMLVGFAYGEGHYKRARSYHPSDGERFSLTIHEKEEPFVTKLLRAQKLAYSSHKRPGSRAYSIEILDRDFKARLLSLGYPRGRKTTQVISCPFKTPHERLLFAKGLWMAEGCFGKIRKNRSVSTAAEWVDAPYLALCTKVEGGIDDIFQTLMDVLVSLGIRSKLRYKINGWGSTQVSLFIDADLDNLLKFYHHFSPWLSYKADRANQILAWVITKTQMLAGRRAKMVVVMGGGKEASVSPDTAETWRRLSRRGIPHTVGLRGVHIYVPPTSKSMRWEMVSKVNNVEAQGEIFDAHIPNTSNFVAGGFISHNTPYREDEGGEELIYALTGQPTGLAWAYFRELNLIKNPPLNVWIEKDEKGRLDRLDYLLQTPMRTLIFCDSLELGERVAKKYNIPFVQGSSKDRINTLKSNQTVVISRVGDEGISLPDLERIIEISWLRGSRRQELQRHGRLLHASDVKGEGEGNLIMTLAEYGADQKRLYSIIDRGFEVKLHKYGLETKSIQRPETDEQRQTRRVAQRMVLGDLQAEVKRRGKDPDVLMSIAETFKGVSPQITAMPGIQAKIKLMSGPSRRLYAVLLAKDSQWVPKNALPDLLGFASDRMFGVDFTGMVSRKWIEEKREKGKVSYRTNIYGVA